MSHMPKTSEAVAAVSTLQQLGYTWEGGSLWKPPLGCKPMFPPPEVLELLGEIDAHLDNSRANRCDGFISRRAAAADVEVILERLRAIITRRQTSPICA